MGADGVTMGREKSAINAERVPARMQPEHSGAQQAGKSAPDVLLGVQRRAGNSAALEFIRQAQTRLDVGASDDPCEIEAETVAQHVADFLHGASAPPASPDEGGAGPQIRRAATIGDRGGETDEATESAILSSRGGGSPMPSDVRTAMESAFGGADFSSVRLHAGRGPATLNRQLSAQAFTVGSDIFFRDGMPAKNRAGHTLLAHELTHTIQQKPGAARKVQRWSPFGKKKEKPKAPDISPFMAQQISSAIVVHPKMVQAEKLRDEGKEEEATQLIEQFWDNDNLLVQNEKGENRLIQLRNFKPLMFTPAEKRMLKVRKWRVAVVVKGMWDEAVRKGEVRDPNPVTEAKDDSKTVNTVGGIIDGVGSANSLAGTGAKIGDKVELHQAAKLAGKVTKGTAGDKIKSGIESSWSGKTSLDTNTISDSNDKNYEASQYANKSEWANGIIGIIGQSISLVSSVVKTISLALDKKASKADVAAQIQDNLSQAAATAGTISQAVENIRGSELTTNMFHWVPGLSVFSNGFAAIGSMVGLVQKAYRVYKINGGRDKTTDKEKEDLSLAMERVWVRAAQQVEQDAFTTAKNLTNTGLAIAEVATAGGFGIPKLAQTVMSAVSAVHSFGHAIADSVRASETKSARKNYFGAKASGSAEKLIRTDPLAAAEAIVSRAGEGDKTARELLEAYDIKIPGLTAPKHVTEKSTGKSGTKNTEKLMEYSPQDVLLYKAGLDKLMNAIAEKDQPQTMWDKIKDGVDSALKAPGQFRDRYRQAKRIAEVRNEQEYGGNKSRGTGWALKQTIFAGDSGVKKLSETTADLINTSFVENKTGAAGPKAKKRFNVDNQKLREELLARIQPESIVRQKQEQEKEERERTPIEVIDPHLVPFWNKAQAMSFSALSNVVTRGRKGTAYTDGEWDVLVAAYAKRMAKEAQVYAGTASK